MYAPPFQNEISFFVDSAEGWKKPTPKKKLRTNAHFLNVLVRDGKAGVSYSECPVPLRSRARRNLSRVQCPICKQEFRMQRKMYLYLFNCSKTECTPTPATTTYIMEGLRTSLSQSPEAKTPKSVLVVGKENCECNKGTTATIMGPKVILRMYANNKQQNIDDLKPALDRLGINQMN